MVPVKVWAGVVPQLDTEVVTVEVPEQPPTIVGAVLEAATEEVLIFDHEHKLGTKRSDASGTIVVSIKNARRGIRVE